MIGQVLGIHLVAPVFFVVEQRVHDTVIVLVTLAELVVLLLYFWRKAGLAQLGVVEIHIPHVVLTGIVPDLQERIHAQ